MNIKKKEYMLDNIHKIVQRGGINIYDFQNLNHYVKVYYSK